MHKVIKYIREERLQKLKAYTRKHHLDLGGMVLEGGGNPLHICCALSSGPVLRFLLSEGVDPVLSDKFGNNPLHILLERALEDLIKGGNSYIEIYLEMVVPYRIACPLALEKENGSGKTGQNLLDRFICQWEFRKEKEAFSGPSPGKPGTSDEEKWREKLRGEYEDEYNMNWGAYESDFARPESPDSESYDDWAERLYSERKRKMYSTYSYTQRPAPPLNKKHKPSSSDFREKHERYQEKMKREREKMRKNYKGDKVEALFAKNQLQKQKTKYEACFNDLLQKENSSVQELGYADIPWPHNGTVAKVMEVLFVGVDKSDSVSYKKYVREQVIRWHPDKFEQKFGHRLKPTEREKILLRVKEISQALNNLT